MATYTENGENKITLFYSRPSRFNNVRYWDGGAYDYKHLFERNKYKLGANWYYYRLNEKNLNYTYNEQGFREKSFSEVDWKNSIVFFGCSNVEGIGNRLEDTICKKLEKILDIPTVNLGQSGSSIDIACANSTILHENFPHPKAIVHIWTSLNRYSDFKEGKQFTSYTPTNKKYFARYNWDCRSINYAETDRALWRNKTLYYEASFFEDTATALKIQPLDQIDLARDRDHPGYQSNQRAAEIIAENLIQQGILK